MEDFAFALMDYIVGKAYIVIPVLLVLGKFLKLLPKCPDWCIPWLLTLAGVALSIMMFGFNVDALIQGILITGAAVYGNQMWKQTRDKR